MAHSWSFGNNVPPNSRSGITGGGGVLSPGSRFGPYEILDFLGEGSSGRVYKARNPQGEVLALKVVKARLDAARRERFLREGAVLAQLSHPGIVRVLTGGEIEGVPFLACELVEAPKNFRSVLSDATLRTRVRMLRDLADAVGHAHARGIVHRDLKPENVLVDSHGRTRLTDLGLALAGGAERLTQTGEVLGTPLYMAPEQTEAGSDSGPTVDVWALGVILYEALSGRLPFYAHGWLELRTLIRQASPPRLEKIAPSLPVELQALCHRTLSADLANRFPDGAALARALDGVLTTLPDSPGPTLRLPKERGVPLRTPMGLGRHGRFDVLEELGRGGMGVVYRALDTELGREVALKVILADRGNTKRLGRFRREGELTATLRHSGILKVHSMGVMDETPYIVYELVEGARTLDDVLDTTDRQSGLELVRDAARALGHAHTHGVVHRDVKPDNLLLDRDGRLLVADFGLAAGRNVERLTRTGAIVGTPHYMAPEQAAGQRDQVGPHTDVWGLGVVLYRLLCGCHPFEGGNFVELSAAIVSKHPTSLRSHDPTIAKDLEAICLTALNKKPAGRYQDGEAFANDLDAFLDGRPPAASGSRAFFPRLKAKRSSLLAIPLFAAGLLAIGLLALRPPDTGKDPTDVSPVVTQKPAPPKPAHPEAWLSEGRKAWRDVKALDGPGQRLARAKAWLRTYDDHPLAALARPLVEDLRFAAPQRQYILTHSDGTSDDEHAYGVFLSNEQLLTYGDDGVVKRWNANTGAFEVARKFGKGMQLLQQGMRSLIPLDEEGRFVAGGTNYLLLASIRDTNESLAFQSVESLIFQSVRAQIALSPDQRNVAVPAMGAVYEYELATQEELRRYRVTETLTAVAYSPDGKRLAAFTGDKDKRQTSNQIYLWDTSTGEQVTRARIEGLVRAAVYTEGGKTLFVGTSTGLLLELDGVTGKSLGMLESTDESREGGRMMRSAHRGSIKGLAFPPGRRILYSVSQGPMDWSCELRLWDMTTRKPLRPPILRPYKLDGVSFSPDGKQFCLSTEAGVVEVWTRE